MDILLVQKYLYKMQISHFKIVFFSCCLMIMVSCRQKKDMIKTDSKVTSNAFKDKLGLSNSDIKKNKLYSFINDWYGVPYKFGGCQKTGVDCSCFSSNLYESVYSKKLPRTATDIYSACEKINLEKAKEGDFVFFKIKSSSISHVGIYLGNNQFVHASSSRGVIVNSLSEDYYKKYFFSAGKLKK